MSKQRVPSYHHHRASQQAVVTLDGQDFYLGKWDSKPSRTEYERLIGEWLANERRLPKEGGETDLRICELVTAYLAFAKGYYAQDGVPSKEYAALKTVSDPVVELYSRSRVTDFGPLALKAIRYRWVDPSNN
jgi:hypothetical protein